MRRSTVQSRCECEARLIAVLDDAGRVHEGWATNAGGARFGAPAHAMAGARGRFDVSWQCSLCGRGTLRSFDTSGLGWRRRDD